MSLPGEWVRRVWYLLNRRKFDENLRRELEAHRAEMSEPARFGNTLRLREESRDIWGWSWLDTLTRDVTLTVRMLRRTPAFTAVGLMVVALGAGVNLAFFQVIDALLLQPHPVRQPETLARFNRVCCGRDASSITSHVPLGMVDYIRRNSPVLSAVLVKSSATLTFGPDGAERVSAAFVSGNWFDELGGAAAMGRVFHPTDDAAGSSGVPIAVLSHQFWQSRLGGRPDVVGTILDLNDRRVTVIGVADPAFADVDIEPPQVWLRSGQGDDFFDPGPMPDREWRRGVLLFGRFAPGLSAAAVDEGLRAALVRLSDERPDQVKPGERLDPLLATARFMEPGERRQVLTLAAAGGALTLVVLLVAVLNLGNLILARSIGRVREMSIRSALGATRWQVMRALAMEGSAIAAAGGVLGVGVGAMAVRAMTGPMPLPRQLAWSMDGRALLAGAGIVVLAALCMAVPAAWRVGRRDLALAVRDGGERATAGLHSIRLRSWLVAGQLAGCAVLLVFAGQLLRGLERYQPAALGFDFADVAVLEPTLADHGLSADAARAYWRDVSARLASSRDVDAVALATHSPLGLGQTTSSYPSAPDLLISTLNVDPSFFPLMRIPILLGRGFGPADTGRDTVIISESVARAMYGRPDVVGEGFPAGSSSTVIVGVAGDAHLFTPHATGVGEAYWPMASSSPEYAVALARASTDVTRLPMLMRAASRAAAPQIGPATRLMRDDFAARIRGPRLASSIAAAIACLALALSGMGIAGVVSHVTQLRTKEAGIRLALGASSVSIVRALLGRSALAAAAGAVAGLGAAVALAHLFTRQPFYINPSDVLPYGIAAVGLTVCVSAAALWPAVRLLRSDPVKALRVD